MSELLNSLNAPETPSRSWAAEVAEAGAAEPVETPATAPEPVAAEPAEPVAPEPVASSEPAAEPEEQDRRVPLKALQEERQKRAEYERQIAEYQRREQEWNAWAAQQQQPQQEPVAEPDPETDPIGALKAARDRLRQVEENATQQQYVQQLNQVAYQSATQYQQQVPDYQDAYRYALNSRAQELAALGTNPETIPSILQREELSLIATAVNNRRNPAEAIYHFAKARGFQGRTAPAAPAAPAATPDPVLQQAKASVAASATSGGAPAAKGDLSDNELANLKGAAFDAAWQKRFGGTSKNSLFRE